MCSSRVMSFWRMGIEGLLMSVIEFKKSGGGEVCEFFQV